MKIKEAQYLNKVSSEALKLNELYQKSVSILRWLTRNNKKNIIGWRVVIEPIGTGYTYHNNAISIKIPKDIGCNEIKSLANACKKQAKEQLDSIKVDLKSVG